MMIWKAGGRKRPWPNLRHYPDICLERLSKTTKPSVSIAGLRTDICNRDLPNTKRSVNQSTTALSNSLYLVVFTRKTHILW
jgi:hypothetical protein